MTWMASAPQVLTDIYQRDLDLTCNEITALDRYSSRV